ncbi:MAG: alcohol dehydrogenase [marine bacterium B5-7]|nr:MAG: alcohol dehydrogenase [marine bacterium B5-7]
MGCQYFEPTSGGADTFTVAMPKLTFGRGCLAELGARAAARGLRRVGLITDRLLVNGPLVDIARRSLIAAGIDVAVFSDIRIEPDQATIEAAAHFVADGKFDGVVSIGGGSSMDTAKAAMVYALYPAGFTDYFGPPVGAGKPVPGPLMPHIACPTTSGTGSECTSVSVIRLGDEESKFVLGSPYLLPDEALVDPACTDSLPANVVASTGYDLLCHALECYTARAYTRWDRIDDPTRRPLLQGANPWSDLAAIKALNIVGNYLERGVKDATDHEARDQLMWGATLAGMAFGNSGTHLAHAMSYGITHLMHDITTDGYPVPSPFIPHGISVVLGAPAIFRFLAPYAPARHLEAAGFLGADTHNAIDDDAGEVLATRLVELMRGGGSPNGLEGVGLTSDLISAMADSSARQTRAIANAPFTASRDDIEAIYRQAISYW